MLSKISKRMRCGRYLQKHGNNVEKEFRPVELKAGSGKSFFLNPSVGYVMLLNMRNFCRGTTPIHQQKQNSELQRLPSSYVTSRLQPLQPCFCNTDHTSSRPKLLQPQSSFLEQNLEFSRRPFDTVESGHQCDVSIVTISHVVPIVCW